MHHLPNGLAGLSIFQRPDRPSRSAAEFPLFGAQSAERRHPLRYPLTFAVAPGVAYGVVSPGRCRAPMIALSSRCVASSDASDIGSRRVGVAISPTAYSAAFQHAGFGSANPAVTTGRSACASVAAVSLG